MPRHCLMSVIAYSVYFALASLSTSPLFADDNSGAAKKDAAKPAPVRAVVETTLTTDREQIRQFVLDGNAESYFASKENAAAKDHFTLTFDAPVELRSVTITSGKPAAKEAAKDAAENATKEGEEAAGVKAIESALSTGANLEVSVDGKTFEAIAKFSEATTRAEGKDRKVVSIRIQPTEDLKHPLVIREIAVDSNPPVVVFKYPVEFAVDVSDAPEMKEWAEKVARVCEREYPMLNEELASEGHKPAHFVTMTYKKNYRGVAATGGGRITGSVKYFKDHPDDVGAMVHEAAHVVQRYRSRRNPGWLVEGVADYVRFFKYEPGKLGRINAERAKYNDSYRTTAAFLAYLAEKYDGKIVLKLNRAMREGLYKDDLFKELTGKTMEELGDEWRATLQAKKE